MQATTCYNLDNKQSFENSDKQITITKLANRDVKSVCNSQLIMQGCNYSPYISQFIAPFSNSHPDRNFVSIEIAWQLERT